MHLNPARQQEYVARMSVVATEWGDLLLQKGSLRARFIY